MVGIIKLRIRRLRDEYLVIVLMTIMALGLTYIFGTSMTGDYKPVVLIVDEDQSRSSQLFIDSLKANTGFRFEEYPYRDAVVEVEEGWALTALVIPKGFDAQAGRGEDISLGIIKVKDDIEVMTLKNLVANAAAKMAGNLRIAGFTGEFVGLQKGTVDGREIESKVLNRIGEAWRFRMPLTVTPELAESKGGNKNDNMKHSTIGFALFFSMYTMVFSIGTILHDRQYKTWQRMLVTPVSRTAILGGSMIVSYLVGALQLGILILAGKYLFGMDWGSSTGGILTVAAAFVFAVTCLGLFLSGLVKTHAQLAAVTPLILTSTAMLGGCMWPLEIVKSRTLLALANLTPQKWAMQGMEGIACYGRGFETVIMPTLVLVGMGLIYFTAGVWMVNKRV